MLRTLFVFLLLILFGATVIYALQNQHQLAIRFVNISITAPAWAPTATAALGVLALCLLYGLVTGTAWRVRYHRLQTEAKDHLVEIEALNRENLDLREELSETRFGRKKSVVS
ncbi:MAG: hypothetical protein ACREN8_07620 [Candidatus Dormibacteraceae bacterium]